VVDDGVIVVASSDSRKRGWQLGDISSRKKNVHAASGELVVGVLNNVGAEGLAEDRVEAATVPVVGDTTTVVAVPDEVLDRVVVDSLVLVGKWVCGRVGG
jgi:hypothetical protein